MWVLKSQCHLCFHPCFLFQPFLFRYSLVSKHFTSSSSFHGFARPVSHALYCPHVTAQRFCGSEKRMVTKHWTGRAGTGYSATLTGAGL